LGIGAEVIAPPEGTKELKENENIPLIVNAWDTDQLIQTCQCEDTEDAPSGKSIDIVDEINYEWSVGGGGESFSNTPANLYRMPEIEVGSSAERVITVKIEDSRGNDEPAFVIFTISLKREEDCKYIRKVSVQKKTHKGELLTITPSGGRCQPQKEKWKAVPALSGTLGRFVLKVCTKQRVMVRANGQDTDTLELLCTSTSCGAAKKDRELIDEMRYMWEATIGSFPDYGGAPVTNSRDTSVIYKAPDEPGEGALTVTIRDGGKQAPDGPIRKELTVKVYRLDLQIDGVAEDDEECEGTHLCLNRDDDDENKTIDRKQDGTVTNEDDLLKITLIKEPKEGKVTLRAGPGEKKIKVWTEKTKVKEVKLPATFEASELPKPLWVEGVEVSEKLRDVELRLESNDPVCWDTGKLTVLTADLDVDTDRDDDVHDEKDETKEEKHDKDLGAIFNVNHDRDGTRSAAGAAGLPLPDAIHFEDDGRLVEVDMEIENADDVKDIAPLVVRQFGFLPPGAKVFLKVAEKEDIQSIHVFEKRAATGKVIWGSVGDRVTGGAAEPTEKDITLLVKLKQDVELGVEGLFFRNTGTINTFNGEIDLTLELRKDGTVLCKDTVRMKVAPWMLLPNTENSLEVWTKDAGAKNKEFLETASAGPGYFGLDNSGQLKTVSGIEAGSQWSQDHIEIGFTQRPKGPKIHSVFRLPYGAQPQWPRSKLLSKDIAIFQLKKSLGGGSGDIGGNLELLPPTATHKLGRIVVGDKISTKLKTFLESQVVQAPFEVPTKWLSVGHVDEAFGFTGNGKEVAIADPPDAYNLMNAIPAAGRGKAVFFATGARPESGVASADATTHKRIETGVDHRNKPWNYIRIYEDSGSGAAGQVGHIKTPGNGFIEIDKVWNTTSNIISPGGGAKAIRDYLFKEAPTAGNWHKDPKKGDKYVLVEGTRFWEDETKPPEFHGTPAIVTVAEVLRDSNLEALNKTDAQGEINRIRTALEAAAGGAGNLTFVKVPVLYVGQRANFSTLGKALAFTPNLANLQPINGKLYFPRQFGPRDSSGDDIFEKTAKSRFATALFVDDWNLYHRLEGEVHCGSNTKRNAPALDWWANQP